MRKNQSAPWQQITALACYIVLTALINRPARAQGPSIIVVQPGIGAGPFGVTVTEVLPKESNVRRIEVHGSRSTGTMITALLRLDEAQLTLAAPLNIRDTGAKSPPGKIDWRVVVTVDVETAKDFSIEMYIQPEGVPADGGKRYRIPLGAWAASK